MKGSTRNCKRCGNEFVASSSINVFCCKECCTKYYVENPIKHEYTLICNYCGKSFVKFLADKPKNNENHYCSHECVGLNKNKVGTGKICGCKECGNEFHQKHKRHFFCCNQCKSRYGTKHVKKKIVNCSNCNKEILRIRNLKNKNFFCCKECEYEFRRKEGEDFRICEYCGETFKCRKGDSLRFCSMKCQGLWQSKVRIGKNSSTYDFDITDEMRIKKCECCGKIMKGTPRIFKTKKYCSNKCKYKSMNNSMTGPHRGVCKILEKNNIDFEIEYPMKRFLFDCYLPEKNLAIEVMGTFYHIDIRFYDHPVSKIQENSIGRDKRKKNLALENNIRILYLWENDINKNKRMCGKLIQEFINGCGIIGNYHSMNYYIKNNELILRKKILVPYFEQKNYVLPLTTGTREIHL